MIARIQDKISLREYEFSKHALDQSILRNIGVYELEEAFWGNCEVVEDYPDDKYGPNGKIIGAGGDRAMETELCKRP